MFALKYLMLGLALVWFGAAAAMLIMDLLELRKLRARPGDLSGSDTPRRPIRWRITGRMMLLSMLPMLLGMSITVIPAGMAGVRISQISGPRPGTLLPGVHWVVPFVHQVELYSTRDHLFSTAVAEDPKRKTDLLKVHTKEGLGVRLAVSVRFRFDPHRLETRSMPLCLSPSKKKSCQRSWPAFCGSWLRTIWCVNSSPPSGTR